MYHSTLGWRVLKEKNKVKGVDRSVVEFRENVAPLEHLFIRNDRLRVGWLNGTLVGPFSKGYHESRRCSRDTYPESCITKYTCIRRNNGSDMCMCRVISNCMMQQVRFPPLLRSELQWA